MSTFSPNMAIVFQEDMKIRFVALISREVREVETDISDRKNTNTNRTARFTSNNSRRRGRRMRTRC